MRSRDTPQRRTPSSIALANRLKSIELGYTIPKIRKSSFGLRVFVNAYNLLTLTGIKYVDPEHPDTDYGRMYPLNKTVSLGMNLSF